MKGQKTMTTTKALFPKPKPRFAKVLFVRNSPFKQKVVRDRTKYTRKVKHPAKKFKFI